jgi:hypothetical protein
MIEPSRICRGRELRIWIVLLGALALCSTSERTAAQTINNAGASGVSFLKIGVGARAMGMGGAFAAMDGDPTLLAWNPAGVCTINQLCFTVQQTVWVADTRHNFVGLVVPVSSQVHLGLHTIYLTTGDIEITTIDNPDGTGSFYDASDIAVGLTSSIRLTSQLAIALTGKYIEQRIFNMNSGGAALDAGAWYATGFRSLKLGFAVSNIGVDQVFSGRGLEVKYIPGTTGEPPANAELKVLPFSLPLLFRASGSFNLFEMLDNASEDHEILTCVDFIQQSDTPERLAAGIEYAWKNTALLRAGYLFNSDELGWGVGGGLRVRVAEFSVDFDYAASSLGRFGVGHRIGLTIAYH